MENRSADAHVPLYYSADYVAAAHAFDTTRKSKRIAEELTAHPIAGLEVVEPTPLTFDEICEVHDPAYVKAVATGEPRHLAESQGFPWNPELWRMVCASNGGVVAAACAVLAGGVADSLSSGLHNARRNTGSAFCTFNGVVLAAKRSLNEVPNRCSSTWMHTVAVGPIG